MSAGGRVQFAIAIPQIFSRPHADLAALQTFLGRADALGYHSVWVQEQMLGVASSLEPVTLLAYAAALTRRVRLGSAVLLTPLRSPVQLAKSLASLDQLSGGRLIAGIGLGGNTRIYPAFGLAPEHRVGRFTEGLELMKRLWTQDRVTFEGRFWKLENAAMAPKPIQKPHPPIWFGGHHPQALARAVALGDGFIGAGSSSTPDFTTQVAHVRRGLEEAKRDPAGFAIAKRVYLLIDPDRRRGLERLREWFGWFYGKAALADQVAVVGGVDECLEGLRAVRAAGAALILLNPVFDELECVERFAQELVPGVSR